jgi:hypothetical protein
MQSEGLMMCAHHPCRCLVETEDEFCSPACRRAQNSSGEPCRCGHPECAEKQKTAGRTSVPRQTTDPFEKRAE